MLNIMYPIPSTQNVSFSRRKFDFLCYSVNTRSSTTNFPVIKHACMLACVFALFSSKNDFLVSCAIL